MFGSVGGMEILVVLVLALLLFGPRKLPQIGRTVGKALSEFRRATTDFKLNLEREVDSAELRETRQEIDRAADEVKQAVVARGSIPAAESATGGRPPASTADDGDSPHDGSSSSTGDADSQRDT